MKEINIEDVLQMVIYTWVCNDCYTGYQEVNRLEDLKTICCDKCGSEFKIINNK